MDLHPRTLNDTFELAKDTFDTEARLWDELSKSFCLKHDERIWKVLIKQM